MLVLVLVLQRFGRRQWGWISELSAENHSVSLHPINADGTLGGDEVDVKFYPEDKIHSSWTLLGRATTVVGANMDVEDNGGITGGEHAKAHGEVKDDNAGVAARKDPEDVQWIQKEAGKATGGARNDDAGVGTTGIDPGIDPSYTINNEADEELSKEWRAYYQARDDYREAYGKTIEMRNLVLKVSWPETSRLEEWKVIEHAQTLGKDDELIRGHIPEVKCARDFGHYSTRHIRGFLGLQPDGCPGTRTLRLVVMNRLRPIYDLGGEHFWKAFWQCVACMCFV